MSTPPDSGPGPANYPELLQKLRDLARSKVKDREGGGRLWQRTNNTLGISALALGVFGGAAILADPKDPLVPTWVLASAVLLGGLLGTIGTFLRSEDRFIANKVEHAAWLALALDIDTASVSIQQVTRTPQEVDQIVQALKADVNQQLALDAERRKPS